MANRIQTEIDIAVKGSAEVKKISKALDNLYGEITQVNNKTGEFVKNFSNLNNILSLVKKNFDNAASGTLQQEKAARLLLVAERQLNKEYQQREALLQRLRTAPMPLPGTGIGRDRSPESFKNRNMKGKRSSLIPGRSLFGQSVTVEGGASGRSRQILQEEQALQEALARMNQRSFGRFKFLPPEELTGQSESIFRGQSSPVEAKIKQTLANRKKSEIEIADIRNRALQKVQANEQRLITLRKNAIKSASGNTGVFSSSAANLVQRGSITGTASQGSTIKSMHKTGFSAFSARADEISRLTTAEQNLSTIRNQAAEKLKSQASIERRRAKTESLGANFRRFRRGRTSEDRAIRGRVASNALIGGAFPLLFGQGGAASAGGALGGATGGLLGGQFGFALSLVGTQLGSLIDNLVGGASKLGQALGPFTQDTEAITASLGLQNSVQQAQIKLIEQVEGKTAAFNAAMKLMANDIGQRGVDALKQFGESSRILSSQFTLAITKLQAFAAGVANFVLRITGLEDRLKKADAGKVVGAAAVRGNSEALGLIQRQKKIDEMDTRGGEGKRKEALQAQLDIEKQIFAIREQQKTKLAEITLEYDQAVQRNKEELQLKEAVKKLTETGMSEAIAKEVAKREQLRDKVLEEVDASADALRLERAKLGNTDKELERLKEIDAKLAEILKKREKIKDETEKTVEGIKKQDKEIKKVKVTKEEIADLLANEMTNALMGLIEGTKSLGESLASIAKSLARMFLNAAFQNIFNHMFQISEQGSYNRAGSFKAFQYGGVVNSPTLGMIGEGGEPEYVIPASKMDGAMARYSAGARGGAVIPGGSHESGTVAGGTGNAIVEYTGPVLNFNGDEYVPKTAVPEIINTAAKQGASAGRSQAFATLKNSRSQRVTLGL